jgi:uncharacterized protein YndB with AHSA1/START domain
VQRGQFGGLAIRETDRAKPPQKTAGGLWQLIENADGTLVTLSQSDLPSIAEMLADAAGARGALSTFWSLAVANLADYLAGRELTPKCDFTSAELRASVVIDAAPERVFGSMTQPEQFRRWFGANVGIEPYVGGRFAMGGFELDPGGATFTEFEPGRKATLRFADGMTDSWEWKGRTARPGSAGRPGASAGGIRADVLKDQRGLCVGDGPVGGQGFHEVAQRLGGRRGDVQQEVVLARQEEDVEDFRQPRHLGHEAADAAAGLRLQPDCDHGLQRPPERGLVDVRVVPADDAALAQRTDPAQTGRRCDADPLGQRVVGEPGVFGQLADQVPVDFVEVAWSEAAARRPGRPAGPNTILLACQLTRS